MAIGDEYPALTRERLVFGEALEGDGKKAHGAVVFGPCLQILSAAAHDAAETVQRGPRAGGPVAVERARRKAEPVRQCGTVDIRRQLSASQAMIPGAGST